MESESQGPGWWIASDGFWYPPELAAGYEPPPQAPEAAPTYTPPAPEPAPNYSPPAPVFEPPGGYEPPAPMGEAAPSQPWWKQSWVLAVGALVVALVIAGALFFSSDDNDADVASTDPTEEPEAEREPAAEPEPDAEPEAQPDAQPPVDDPDERTPTVVTDVGDGCSYAGLDSFGDMQAELRFTNEATEPGDMTVTFGFFEDGTRFLTSDMFINAGLPGERFRIGADTVEDLPNGVDESTITCEILEIESFEFGVESTVSGASCVFVDVDAFDDIQVEVTATNQFGETGDLFLNLALRSNGVRFGTSFASIDAVPPGEQVRESVDTLLDLPEWATDVTCQVVSIDSF